MPVYKAPLDNIRFVLNDVLAAHQLASLPGYEDMTPELVDQILGEAARICEDVLFPLNQSGDEEACHFDKGEVRTPKGFKQAYDIFAQGGWCGVAADPEYGGMGLPMLVNNVIQEMICAANMSFGMYPGLSQGAYEALYHFGDEQQKSIYLPKLASGQWAGTMCLTEPQCGTDLGLIKSRAEPLDNGAYKITGTKIFISAGEHDLTENIIHLVLAKLPDAPEGVKGISLFVVPKFIPVGNEIGPRNQIYCGSIEHKMGIKASSTCVMNLDGAQGWLVGEPHKGLRAMFKMMNAARLGVAMQGLGIAEVAWQNGLAYAQERLQMRALTGAKEPDKPADPIIVHPDVRRMLLTAKAFTEGARALSYYIGMNLDISLKHPDPAQRAAAGELVSLLIPVVKSYQTDMGYEIASLAMQIYGGHGYISENGIEQYVRDARITMIYEGTNGIQALDLVGRKMTEGYGRLLRRFFHPVHEFISTHQNDPALAEFILPLAKAFGKLQQASAFIAQKSLKNPDEAGAAASDYLRMFALVAMGYMWARMVQAAQKNIADNKGDPDFHDSKIHTARFFMTRMLPELDHRFKAIMAGSSVIMTLRAEAF